MLQKAEGSICQATNLLKALSHQPQGLHHYCLYKIRVADRQRSYSALYT
jgi:hypothetical protein